MNKLPIVEELRQTENWLIHYIGHDDWSDAPLRAADMIEQLVAALLPFARLADSADIAKAAGSDFENDLTWRRLVDSCREARAALAKAKS